MATNNTTPESYSGTNAAEAPSKQQIFDVLSNERRRRVISALVSDESTTVSALSTELAAEENDCSPLELTSQQRKRLYISLYQSHLGKLAEIDVINYNEARGRVRRGDHFWAFADVLDVAINVCEAHDVGGAA